MGEVRYERLKAYELVAAREALPDGTPLAVVTGPSFAREVMADLPAGTKSLVLLCHDPDVPTRPDDVNQEGRVVPSDLPRFDFFHWVLVDIPPAAGGIAEGSHADGVTPRGKPGPDAPGGMRHGLNNYTDWFAGDADMEGQYFGYDGPCPPWNDSIVHHYVFTLFALDVERCPVHEVFGGGDVREAIAPHVLGQASLTGNPIPVSA